MGTGYELSRTWQFLILYFYKDKILITIAEAKKSEIGHYVTKELEKKLHTPRHSLLTAFLLSELDKGNQSKWNFYFDFLPSNYEHFPIFYKEKELEYLKGTQFFRINRKRKETFKRRL